jgi:hypothetical protein
VSDGISSEHFLPVVETTAELFSGSLKGIIMFLKVKTSSQMLMVEEVECQLVKRISRIKIRTVRIMIKLRFEKIGKPRKFGGIIKVS